MFDDCVVPIRSRLPVPFGLVRSAGCAPSPGVVSKQFFVAAKVLNRLQLSLTIARIY
jgi:hypothetical protein